MKVPRPHWWPAYVGIGSNLDGPTDRVRSAFDDLAALPDSRVELRSPLYRSAPVGPPDQPDYVNAVAGLLTRLAPEELLVALQQIEARHGRERGERWGPRTLDLDLLVHGREIRDTAGLVLPHPRIAERNFVLLPLRDIAPHLAIPGRAEVAALAAAIAGREPRIERLDTAA